MHTSHPVQHITDRLGNEFFAEVEEDYIQDDFNLTGLNSMVPYYDLALDLILDADTDIDSLAEDKQEIVETAAEVLYGLIHARYILTSKGMLYMVSIIIISSCCIFLLRSHSVSTSMKNFKVQTSVDVHARTAKVNPFFLWDYLTSQGITQSMSFVHVAKIYTTHDRRNMPISMEPTLAPPFPICFYYRTPT